MGSADDTSQICSADAATGVGALVSSGEATNGALTQITASRDKLLGTAASAAQRTRAVRAPDSSDPLLYALDLLERIRRISGSASGACDKIITTASADPGRFAAGLAVGVGTGMLNAAKDWFAGIVQLLSDIKEFFAGSPLEATALAAVQTIATLEAAALASDAAQLGKIATALASLGSNLAGPLPFESELLIVASSQLLLVAEAIEGLRGSDPSGWLDVARVAAEAVSGYCLERLGNVADSEPFGAGTQLGELVGRVVGEVTLIALGL